MELKRNESTCEANMQVQLAMTNAPKTVYTCAKKSTPSVTLLF